VSKILLSSPRLRISATCLAGFLSSNDRCSGDWMCSERAAFHLGLDCILKGDSVWFVASSHKPRHSAWNLKASDRAGMESKEFIDRALAAGCKYFWLEWEAGS